MRPFVLLIIFLLAKESYGQHNVIDSLQIALKKERTDTAKVFILVDLSFAYQSYKPDSALLLAQAAYDLAVKRNFLSGESWALNQIAGAFSRMGNTGEALRYYLQQLKIEEERKSPYNLATINMNIALVYNREKDPPKAIYYILKADSIISSNNLRDLELYGLLNTGDIFEKANRLPEALSYTKQCYELARKKNDSLMLGSALNNTGNIYAKMGDLNNAIAGYRQSLPYLVAANDKQTISEGKLGLSNAFDRTGSTDSALQYAMTSYNMSVEGGFLKNALGASALLVRLYKKKNDIDNAFAYQEIMLNLKDSLEGIDKIKELESMSIEEQLRQQHLRTVAEQEKVESSQRLQLLAIGMIIPVFFLASMYISRKKVSVKLIKYSGVISLLLLFEYLTLLSHPVVSRITHHTPLLEILIFVGMAMLAVPAHHKIESWFTKRLAGIHEKHMNRNVTPVNIDGERLEDIHPGEEVKTVEEDVDVFVPGENKNAPPGE